MHEHECIKCGEKFENMLWIDTVCSECEQIEELLKGWFLSVDNRYLSVI